jgi:hypothetical protein
VISRTTGQKPWRWFGRKTVQGTLIDIGQLDVGI